ncbi:lipopolysaccharide biosynthesis protein [Diaminobutyricibacter tongyongensis]|uniref:Lipopolysaccharide biosynthesis protein n=1 Tax=Leifsonia tongyongensis TaxID=1268043 RepID=A0A6L9XVI9_9MICO|nr:lipopolysaccharide biosynthesis protein [Diaminobutyricibacter tongyongensis]NEN05450.1 lipopolysaccharide biosynthesis protein [Diaminobutyricibacter tongyongensis]
MKNRGQRLLGGIASSAVSRGTAAIAPIITVPVALTALGVEGYGAWSAALALTAFTAFADLGIGAGLMTRLSASIASGDVVRSRRLVSSAYTALGLVVTLALILLWASSAFVPWARVVGGVGSEANGEVGAIALVTLTGFILNVIAGLIVRVQYAAQEVARSNLWQASGSVAGIIAVLVAASLGATGAVFVAVAAFVPILVAGMNAVLFFSGKVGKQFRPSVRDFHLSTTRDLASIGGRFLTISITMSVALGVDSWIVAQTSSLSQVPEYAIPARVFAMVGTLVSVLTIPLWPTSAEALSAGDTAWVRRTARRMTMITPAIVGAASVIAVVAAPFAFNVWLGGKVPIDFFLLAGLALWNVVQACVAPAFMVQNAAGVLRPQMIGYAVLLAIFPVKWIVASTLGFAWLPLVTSIAYVLIIWPAAWVGYRRALNRPSEVAAPVEAAAL